MSDVVLRSKRFSFTTALFGASLLMIASSMERPGFATLKTESNETLQEPLTETNFKVPETIGTKVVVVKLDELLALDQDCTDLENQVSTLTAQVRAAAEAAMNMVEKSELDKVNLLLAETSSAGAAKDEKISDLLKQLKDINDKVVSMPDVETLNKQIADLTSQLQSANETITTKDGIIRELSAKVRNYEVG
jgi:TolA-binding protein